MSWFSSIWSRIYEAYKEWRVSQKTARDRRNRPPADPRKQPTPDIAYPVPREPAPPKPEEPNLTADGGMPRNVKWLHTDVSGWKQTSVLKSVKIKGGMISLDYDKSTTWPGRNHMGAFVNANPWIFVLKDGQWYAATWEWLRYGQTEKGRYAVAGDHIKRDPLKHFKPAPGETYGFMVSGLARDRERNVKERTNVLMLVWP